MPPIVEAEQGRAPGDQRAGGDGDQAGRNALGYLHAAEPAHEDDREADDADHRRHEHLQRRAHRDEGDRDAGQRAEQRGARRDLADDGRDEAADHQHEALDEHPGQAGLPALDRIAGRERDRQHDHEGDDEHVRHADARGQRADVGAAGLLARAGRRARRSRSCDRHIIRPSAGRMRPNTRSSGIFSTKRSSAGQRQQVDQDVGAEAEEGVPVARRPEFRFERRVACAHHVAPLMPRCGRLAARASAARMLRRVR